MMLFLFGCATDRQWHPSPYYQAIICCDEYHSDDNYIVPGVTCQDHDGVCQAYYIGPD